MYACIYRNSAVIAMINNNNIVCCDRVTMSKIFGKCGKECFKRLQCGDIYSLSHAHKIANLTVLIECLAISA